MSDIYRVIVEGSNFLLPLNSQEKSVGFFSTFSVESSSLENIKQDLKPIVLFRVRENHLKIRTGLFSSRVEIEGIYLDKGSNDDKAEGFTFYEMSFVSKIFCIVKSTYLKFFFPERVIEYNSIDGVSID